MLEIEGSWEDILAHATVFAGRRVRVTLLPEEPESAAGPLTPDERAQRMRQLWKEWRETGLSEEETAILDEFEQFRQENPFRLRQLGDE
jgi:hypothetical protein